jgi:CDP-diacylglycerol--serine O-phosphatidyltransferase
MSYLLVMEMPLLALKFKSFGWKGNEFRFIFIGLTVLLLILLKIVAIPVILVLYVLISIVSNYIGKNKQGLG